jgi:hypothetical protein
MTRISLTAATLLLILSGAAIGGAVGAGTGALTT